MSKIDDMVTAGLPIIASQSYEPLSEYIFSRSLTNAELITFSSISTAPTLQQMRQKQRKSDAIIEASLAVELKSLTPQEAVNYIENNVTNLATAKDVLKIMARMMIAMRDELWSNLPEK